MASSSIAVMRSAVATARRANGVSTVSAPLIAVSPTSFSEAETRRFKRPFASRRLASLASTPTARSFTTASMPVARRRISSARPPTAPAELEASPSAWSTLRSTSSIVPASSCTTPDRSAPRAAFSASRRTRVVRSASVSAMIVVASEVRLASAFTSFATTAKPLPAAPARAASIDAFSASRFVCRAMPSMSRATRPTLPSA